MRRIAVLFICAVFVWVASFSFAQPVGNIATPAVLKKGLVIQEEGGQWGIILNSENDITFDRNMEKQDGDTEFNFFGGKAGLILMDRFIAYGLLGAGKAEQKFDISGSKVKWTTDYDFVWGLGGTAMLYETKLEQMGNGTLRFGVDGRYRAGDLKVDKVEVGGTSYNTSSAAVTSTKYNLAEWQIAAALSYQIDKFIPYVGCKYSDMTDEAKTTISGTEYKVDLKNDCNFGLFVGGDFLVNDSVILNVEGRFIDETALSLTGTVRF